MVAILYRMERFYMRKAIIINDSKLERAVLKDRMTNLGYSVIIADEYSWFNKLKNEKPTVAIVNYTMEEITGDKIISAINTNFPDVKCYLSSCNKLNPRDFKDINIERIITTPISITNLENILTNKDACLNCGKLLTENFRFCPHCGAEV